MVPANKPFEQTLTTFALLTAEALARFQQS
jgi:hypothetical protein